MRDTRQLFTVRWINRVEILSRSGRPPLPTNKVMELVAVAFQPGLGLLGIFRRRPVLHADKFFGDAHSVHFFRRLALGDWMPVLGGISPRRMMLQLPLNVTQ